MPNMFAVIGNGQIVAAFATQEEAEAEQHVRNMSSDRVTHRVSEMRLDPCPSCLKQKDMTHPAISRFGEIDICSECGTNEALYGHFWWDGVCKRGDIGLAIPVLCRQLEKAYYSKDHRVSFSWEAGPKYVRIIETFHYTNNDSRSVFTFVEKATGNIYYPKSWKGPKLKRSNGQPDVRGNVFTEGYGMDAFNKYGTNTLR